MHEWLEICLTIHAENAMAVCEFVSLVQLLSKTSNKQFFRCCCCCISIPSHPNVHFSHTVSLALVFNAMRCQSTTFNAFFFSLCVVSLLPKICKKNSITHIYFAHVYVFVTRVLYISFSMPMAMNVMAQSSYQYIIFTVLAATAAATAAATTISN